MGRFWSSEEEWLFINLWNQPYNGRMIIFTTWYTYTSTSYYIITISVGFWELKFKHLQTWHQWSASHGSHQVIDHWWRSLALPTQTLHFPKGSITPVLAVTFAKLGLIIDHPLIWFIWFIYFKIIFMFHANMRAILSNINWTISRLLNGDRSIQGLLNHELQPQAAGVLLIYVYHANTHFRGTQTQHTLNSKMVKCVFTCKSYTMSVYKCQIHVKDSQNHL